MKDPRDIRLVGIGFLLGMVFCYFLTAAKLADPGSGTITAAFTTAPAVTNSFAARFVGLLPETPSPRYLPAQKIENFRFDIQAGPQYDLIDFNYVPDFKLPSDQVAGQGASDFSD
jgi:hypothetical protein